MRIPVEWRHLHKGDRIHTTLPFHRIQAGAKALRKDGWKFETEPSARGYWLICIDSPLVSPHRTGEAT